MRHLRRENKRLEMERSILKKAPSREREHMRFVFIHAERASYPVRMLCRVLEVSRSGYYAWLGRSPSARKKADAQLATKIAAVHKKSRGTYGSPRSEGRKR